MPQVRRVVERYAGLVDEFQNFPGFPGIAEYPFVAARFAAMLERALAGRPSDLAIQMRGSGSVSNVFTALLGARRSVGWHVPGLWCPDARDYAPFPDALSEVDRWLALVARIGCGAGDARLAFPIAEDERAAARRLLAGIDGARLVVTNDTGTSHLCAALRTPSLVLFIVSDPARRAPADDALHIAVGRGVADRPVGHAAPPLTFALPTVDEALRAPTILLEYA